MWELNSLHKQGFFFVWGHVLYVNKVLFVCEYVLYVKSSVSIETYPLSGSGSFFCETMFYMSTSTVYVRVYSSFFLDIGIM